jgi:hypothetical protein
MATMDELHKKLDEIDGVTEEDKSKISSLLRSASERYKTVKVGEIELKIRSVLPRQVRHKLFNLLKKYQGVEEDPNKMDISELEDEAYEILATMCLESPFNKVETWRIIDDEQGIALDILGIIQEEAIKTEKEIKTFR